MQLDGITAQTVIAHQNQAHTITASGNGRLDAVSNCIKQYFDVSYELSIYEEHALSKGSSSKAMSYVGISCDGEMYWGIGVDDDIIKSSFNALVVAVNKLPQIAQAAEKDDTRLIAMKNYIQANYQSVTLQDMAEKFSLSEPYISKFFKEKSGVTFVDYVQGIRMKKAKTLLKNTNMSVESIAEAVGYSNVEHFSRQFKKKYGLAPIQYRVEEK